MALFGRPTRQDDQKAQAYAQWVQQRNPFAIASMVLGVCSLIELGVLIVFGVASITLGVIALRQLANSDPNDSDAKPRGHRLAWGGIALSVVSLILAAILYLHRRGHP
jgi:ABC-type branched-subunit amino acid transport system permease subunit